MIRAAFFLAACAAPVETGKPLDDSEVVADSADTMDSGDTDDTDTGDTGDTGDTVDTNDTGADTGIVHIYGVLAYDDLGNTIDVGDVDGDGRDDLLVGTLYADGTRGGGYLVPGARIAEGAIDTMAWHVEGDVAGGGAGRSVGLGDVDGDGTLDLGFGVPYSSPSGVAVVVGPITSDRAIADSPVKLNGEPGTYCGHGMDLGDVDGDGIADGVAGAYGADPNGPESGAVYVRRGPLTGQVDLATEADAELRGEGRAFYTGRTLRAGDDLDGDGIGDLVIAAPYASPDAPYVGVVYAVAGPVADMDLADADGRFVGAVASDYLGTTLGRGDVDGDGLADLLAGGWNSTAAPSAGAAYVVFGPATGSRSIAEADILVLGDTAQQLAGTGLAAGVVDGQPALLVGAPGDASAYLFLGPAPGTWSVTDATESWHDSGSGLGEGAALADLDGDGGDEIVLGAPTDGTGGTRAGALWVIGL